VKKEEVKALILMIGLCIIGAVGFAHSLVIDGYCTWREVLEYSNFFKIGLD
jgi:hypothetical protein